MVTLPEAKTDWRVFYYYIHGVKVAIENFPRKIKRVSRLRDPLKWF